MLASGRLHVLTASSRRAHTLRRRWRKSKGHEDVAGAVVLRPAAARATLAWVPARVLRVSVADQPLRPMDEILRDLRYEAFVYMF
jgi:hypothetical protein